MKSRAFACSKEPRYLMRPSALRTIIDAVAAVAAKAERERLDEERDRDANRERNEPRTAPVIPKPRRTPGGRPRNRGRR